MNKLFPGMDDPTLIKLSLAEFVHEVRIMRAAQKEYFHGRAPELLIQAKNSEKEVDRLLEALCKTKWYQEA